MLAIQGFALFDTALGRCGIAWGERGIVGVQLPEAREAATRARVRRRFPGARWRPYRTVASWYLWRAAELDGTQSGRVRGCRP